MRKSPRRPRLSVQRLEDRSVPAADLTVTAVLPPAAFDPGVSFTVDYTVTNSGDEATDQANGYSIDALYLSTSPVFDASARYVALHYRNDPLGAGASYSGTFYSVEGAATQDLPPGDYYLYVVADAYGYEPEGVEDNNTGAAAPIAGNPGPDVDLVVSALSVAPDPGPGPNIGDYLTVTYTVTNQGTATADRYGNGYGYWVDAFYLSADDVLDPSDPLVDYEYNFINPPLGGGESYQRTVSVRLPSGPAGPRYLIAAADGGRNYSLYQPETDGTNNARASAVLDLTGPDLTAALVQPAGPVSGVVGGTVPAGWTVTNGGNGRAAGYWYDTVYLSLDDTLDYSDISVGSFGRPDGGLAAGGQYTALKDVPIPARTAPGDYYLLVAADPFLYGYSQQPETDDANNTAPGGIPVTLRAPDLTAAVTAGPAAANVGDRVELTWKVTNATAEPALGYWSEAVYVSDDATWDPSDTLADEFYHYGGLDAGASYDRTESVLIPSTAAGDKRYLLVVIDRYGGQGETDEGNNTGARAVEPLTGPDLTVTLDAAPAEAVVGDTIELKWTVKNEGNGPATAAKYGSGWYDWVFLSTRPVYDYSAERLDFLPAGTVPLAAGDSYSTTASFTLSAYRQPETYYLYVWTDGTYYGSDGFQPETNDRNNFAPVAAITLLAPDLTVALKDPVPTAGNVGDPLAVSWTVTNASPNPALGRWTDYLYVSDDEALDYTDTYLGGFDSDPPPLAPGASYDRSAEVVIPSTRAGARYLLVVTNSLDGGHGETDHSNNLAAVPLSLTGPDLTVTLGTLPAAGVVGQQLVLEYTVKNEGDGAANGSWADFVFVSHPYHGTYYLDNFARPNTLAPGESYTQTVTVTLPAWFSAADVTLFVRADGYDYYYGDQPETNNFNNTSGRATVSLAAPDLAASAPPDRLYALAGGTVGVNWTVDNASPDVPALAPYWNDVLFISHSAVPFSYPTLYVGEVGDGGPLDPATGAARSATISLPNPAWYWEFGPGDYYLQLFVDYHDYQGETDNSINNFLAIPITLVANEAPALGPVGDREVNAGDTLTFAADGSDPNGDLDTLAYALEGAVPGGAWIDPATGAFAWAPDGSLAGQSFTFDVVVRDSLGLEDRETITVRVFGAPTDITLAGSSVPENAPAGTAVGTVTAADPDADVASLELVPGEADNDRFALGADGVLRTAASFDYETRAAYTVRVRATDARGLTRVEDLAVAVDDLPESVGFDVSRGRAQRSFIRYIDLTLDSPAAASALLGSGRVRLVKRDLAGNNPAAVALPAGAVSAAGSVLTLNFGPNGLGGSPASNAADGYYTVELDFNGDGTYDAARKFYRLLGDTNGDRVVDQKDVAVANTGRFRYVPEADMDGDGKMTETDRTVVAQQMRLGRKLAAGLPLDD